MTNSTTAQDEPLTPAEWANLAEMAAVARVNPNARLRLLNALVEHAGLIEAIATSLLADEFLNSAPPMLPAQAQA